MIQLSSVNFVLTLSHHDNVALNILDVCSIVSLGLNLIQRYHSAEYLVLQLGFSCGLPRAMLRSSTFNLGDPHNFNCGKLTVRVSCFIWFGWLICIYLFSRNDHWKSPLLYFFPFPASLHSFSSNFLCSCRKY